MDKMTWLGIIFAISAVILSIVVKGINFSIFLNYPAILLIFVGTFAAIMISYPNRDIKKIGKLMKIITTDKSIVDLNTTIKTMVGYAGLIRREGILVLEREIDKTEHDFLKTGLSLLVEGMKGEEIREILEEDLYAREERHSKARGIFSSAGAYAPALGVLGAVFGLMSAMANMTDMEALSYSVASAFVATIFGIFSAYIFWHPFASKLKRKSEEETLVNVAILEGILALEQGKTPTYVIHKMVSYLPTSEREQLLEEIKDGKKAA